MTDGGQPTVRMSIKADASNVMVVRHAIAGLAETAGMEAARIADLKTALTEACMNAIVHAYPDGEGAVLIEAIPDADSLTVVVSDTGTGIRPRADVEEGSNASLRLGLSLISSLTSSFSIAGGLGQGTVVTMRFPLLADDDEVVPEAAEFEPAGGRQVSITTSAPALLPTPLARTVSAFGANRDLPSDRISDAMLLADAISDVAPTSFGDRDLEMAVSDGNGGIEFAVGPLADDGEVALRQGLKVPGGGTIEAVADEVRTERDERGTYVVFRISGPTE